MKRIRDHQTSNQESYKKSGSSSPGPIGGASSYGMDKGTYEKSIGSSGSDHDRSSGTSAPKKEEPSIVENISDWVGEKIQGVSDWFSGKEDTGGFSPMGGASSYGMEKKTFDDTVGERRHKSRSLGERMSREVDYFQEAPLDYVGDLMDNPLVSGAAMFTGLGTTAFGVKLADTIADIVQRETSPEKALTSTAGSLLQHTTIGADLGIMKPVASGALKSGMKGASQGFAGVVGGQLGAGIGGDVISSFTDNPYVSAAVTAGAGVAAAKGSKKAVALAQAQPKVDKPVVGMRPPRDHDSSAKESPLVSSGKRAMEASERLKQPADVGLYARTVQQLPFYGLDTKQQLPYYGV